MANLIQYDNILALKHLQPLQNLVSYFWLRASNEFGVNHYDIQTIKIVFINFECLWLFSIEGYIIWNYTVF